MSVLLLIALGSLPGGSALEQLMQSRNLQDSTVAGTQLGMSGWNSLYGFGTAMGDQPNADGTSKLPGALAAAYGVHSGDSGIGVPVTLNLEQYSSEKKWTQSAVTQINANQIVINAHDDLNLVGGTQATATTGMTLTAGNNLNISAAKDILHNSSSQEGVSVGVSVGAGGTGVTVGGNYAESAYGAVQYTNAQLTAGKS